MSQNYKTFRNYQELSLFIKGTDSPLVFKSSGTSTVLPFDKVPEDIIICDITTLPKSLRVINDQLLEVKGPISWQEAREFLKEYELDIMTAPTEDSALILAGLATSATGERAFGLGTLRDQVTSMTYIDDHGEEQILNSTKNLAEHDFFESNYEALLSYQETYRPYANSKNAPFPRMKQQTDLMIGSEGQLGLITSCLLKLTRLIDYQYILIKLPKFEDNIDPHLEIYEKIQAFRQQITSCEMIDSNSLNENYDGLYLEIKSKDFEEVYEKLLSNFESIKNDEIFELTKAKYKEIREGVPRATNEYLSRNFLTKKGTDAQAMDFEGFKMLLEIYQGFSKLGVNYQLFGHFGDAHLHFNFLPTKQQTDFCDKSLDYFYDKVSQSEISPFAEHGVGLIKRKFITSFLHDEHYNFFQLLKNKMDSKNIFFPMGFMGGDLKK